jgi:class 3 adenylate cyclase
VSDRSLLIIADIGGYTQFMRLHRMSLAHSQDVTGRLLKAVVKSSPLPVVELEGDAVFFCAPVSQADADAVTLSLAMHRAFHSQLDRMIALNMCSCDACMQSRNLKVKFVGHVGEVAMQTVGGRENLVGVDVIAVHRMLKNAVPTPEYVLMTESVVERCAADIREGAGRIEQDLEGLGPTSLYFVDLEQVALDRPPPPKPTVFRRLGETMGVVSRGLPTMLGLRSSQRSFKSA